MAATPAGHMRRGRSPMLALFDIRKDGDTDSSRILAEYSASDWELLHKLYSSGDSAVYKAKYKPDGRLFAVKQRVSAELGAKGDILHEMKLNVEAKALVRCFGAYWHPAHVLHMVFEWADGGDLLSVIRQRRIRGGYLPEVDLWRWACQLFTALAALHARRIIHRDVKASNILLFSRTAGGDGCSSADAVDIVGPGQPIPPRSAPVPPSLSGSTSGPAESPWAFDIKLGDLGVARSLGGGGDFASTLYGTPLYMSPELLDAPDSSSSSIRYTVRTDQWSSGVTLYELSALASPFHGQSMATLSTAIRSGRYRPLPSLYSTDWQSFVSSLLQRSPEQRPSATQAVAICEAWLSRSVATTRNADAAAATSSQLNTVRMSVMAVRKARLHRGAASPRVGEGFPGVRVEMPAPPLLVPMLKLEYPPLLESVAEREEKAVRAADGVGAGCRPRLEKGKDSSGVGDGGRLAEARHVQEWTGLPRGGAMLPSIPEGRGARGQAQPSSPGLKQLREEVGLADAARHARVRGHGNVPAPVTSSPMRPGMEQVMVEEETDGEGDGAGGWGVPPPAPLPAPLRPKLAASLAASNRTGPTRVRVKRKDVQVEGDAVACTAATPSTLMEGGGRGSAGGGESERVHPAPSSLDPPWGRQEAARRRATSPSPPPVQLDSQRWGRHLAEHVDLQPTPAPSPPARPVVRPLLPGGVRGTRADMHAAAEDKRVHEWAANRSRPLPTGMDVAGQVRVRPVSAPVLSHAQRLEGMARGRGGEDPSPSPSPTRFHRQRGITRVGNPSDVTALMANAGNASAAVASTAQRLAGRENDEDEAEEEDARAHADRRESLADMIARRREERRKKVSHRWNTELQAAGFA